MNNPLLNSLDPISLILSQNTFNTDQPFLFKLTTESVFMDKGPRYREYSNLRDNKLRMKFLRQQEREEEAKEIEFKQSPVKKQVKFQSSIPSKAGRERSVLYQSVPNFSSVLKKENQKPSQQLTPPPKSSSKMNGVLTNSKGSKSTSAAEKKSVLMPRKSYACLEDLKKSTATAANAINGGNRGIRGVNGGGGGGVSRGTGRVLRSSKVYH